MGSAWQPSGHGEAYYEALEHLPGGGHRELEPGVLLVDRKDRVAVLHGTTDVVSYLPDGSFVIYMGGSGKPSVVETINRYVPYTGGWLRDPLGGTPTWQCPDGDNIPLSLYGAYRVVPDGSAVGSVPAPPTQPVEGHGGVVAWEDLVKPHPAWDSLVKHQQKINEQHHQKIVEKVAASDTPLWDSLEKDENGTPLVPDHIAKNILADHEKMKQEYKAFFHSLLYSSPYPTTEAEAFSDPSPQVEGWKVREGIKEAGVDLEVSVRHPEDECLRPLRAVIVSLNDQHGWTREQIADWLDTLDIDLTLQPTTEPVSNEATEKGA